MIFYEMIYFMIKGIRLYNGHMAGWLSFLYTVIDLLTTYPLPKNQWPDWRQTTILNPCICSYIIYSLLRWDLYIKVSLTKNAIQWSLIGVILDDLFINMYNTGFTGYIYLMHFVETYPQLPTGNLSVWKIISHHFS